VELVLLAALAGAVLAFAFVARQWTGVQRPTVDIDLSLRALPKYALLSFTRAAVAYGLSLGFTLLVAYWAAKDPAAERILIPILDILQSIPLLAFLPGVLLAMLALFPRSNLGLELSAVLLLVTCQAWNMAFSFYQSLKTLPRELEEASRLYRFTWLRKLRWVELPFAAPGLVWNSMVSVANSWFFLMNAEAFQAGHRDFRLPGLGAYMKVAVDAGDRRAQTLAVLAMLSIVLLLDQLVWKPVVSWSRRFQMDESAPVEREENRLLRFFRRSRLLRWAEEKLALRRLRRVPRPAFLAAAEARVQRPGKRGLWLATAGLLAVVGLLALGAVSLSTLLGQLEAGAWLQLAKAGLATLARVLGSTLLATAWTLPVGLWLGLNPAWSKRLQSVVQVAAAYPFSLLFAPLIIALKALGVDLGVTSVLLMALSTMFYLLFNIIAGAQDIPADLREAARAYRLPLWQRCRTLYFPAIFPYLVTGWVTATGGAWNASIVAEYGTNPNNNAPLQVRHGLGAKIMDAADKANWPQLAAAVLVMSLVVVLFNRSVWHRLYRLAEKKFSLTK
jgi:NitT/TauT family transport system permease protein